jgi:hypothetical protein
MKDKFVVITALAFSDQQDLKRLSGFASRGLLMKDFRVPLLSYRLLPNEKQDIDYLIDFHQEASQNYFDSYSQNGWEPVFSYEDLHYFKAAKGTEPFYTDVEGKVQRYRKVSNRFGLYTLISLFPALLFGYLLSTFQSSGEIVTLPLFVLTGLSIMSLLFCGMPFVTYHFRAKRVDDHR